MQLVTNYGYLGLYIYFIIDTLGVLHPSKSILALIGYLIGKEVYIYTHVVAAAVLGSLTGVSVSFAVGSNITINSTRRKYWRN